MSRTKSLLKNTIIIAFGTFLPQLMNVVTLPILTAKLSKEAYGYYDLIITLVSLLLPAITLQIQAAGFRFLISCKKDKEKSTEYITNIFFVLCVSVIISGIVLFFIFKNLNLFLLIIVILYFSIDVLNSAVNQILRGFSKNLGYSIGSIIQSLVKMLVVCILLFPIDGKLEIAVIALLLGVTSSLIYESCLIKLWKYINFSKVSKRTIKELLSYSWPMVPNTLSGWILRTSDRLIITYFLGIEQMAVYAVANKIPNLLTTLNNTFNLAWQENASIYSKDEDIDEYYSDTFKAFTSFICGCCALIIASTPILFPLLIKGNYEGAYQQMPILYIGFYYSCISSYLGGIYIANKRTKNVGITTMIAAVINLAIDFALINVIGIAAGSISTLVSYIILVLYRMKDIKKFQNIKYNYKAFAVNNLILIIMSAICYCNLFMLNVVNIILGIMAMYLLNKKIIFKILKRISSKLKRKRVKE